jgi:copper homeostasis protein
VIIVNILKEVCVGNYEEAVRALELGAYRIELCKDLAVGGVTPSYTTILKAIKLPVQINVIIRPREGDFVYTNDEFKQMKEDINFCKNSCANGVVLGILTKEKSIDIGRTRQLIELANPLPVTFHMAFDEVEDKLMAIDQLVGLGVSRILTKGGLNSALDNLDTLKKLVKYANKRIIVMPGGGVTKENAELVVDKTGAIELHGTKIIG